MLFDIFVHVVDNFGDIGVGWRLAADMASRGHVVRLWVDDAAALGWMAPGGARSLKVLRWADPLPNREPGDVVIETFGCHVPARFVARMQRANPPLWINLEHLSAEGYVERSHALPSPQQSGPGAGLTKWFVYPGFTARTAGLLREPGLLDARAAFDRAAWLPAHGLLQPVAGERLVSLFCYHNERLDALLAALAARPTLLLATPDHAARQVRELLGPSMARGRLRTVCLPYLAQPDYDRLLWSCDVNLVRGEDSFVRAQWAGVPFLWQPYPQADGAHAGKLEAFLDRYLEGCAAPLARDLRRCFARYNGLEDGTFDGWPDAVSWKAHTRRWTERLASQPDLTSQLLDFIAARRG
jgi:uncharacterized repeat protein (TIGR03837 family)